MKRDPITYACAVEQPAATPLGHRLITPVCLVALVVLFFVL